MGDLAARFEEICLGFEALFRNVIQSLVGLTSWEAALLVPIGLISLLYGLKLFRIMVIIYAAMAGAVLGGMVGAHYHVHQAIGMGFGALVLALVTWPLLRYAVGVFGGIAGAAVGAVLFYWTGNPTAMLVATLVGLVLGVVLAFMVFRAFIIFTTCILGAQMVVTGIVVLLMAIPRIGEAVRCGIGTNPFLLPVLVGVPAVIGVIYQVRNVESGDKKADGK